MKLFGLHIDTHKVADKALKIAAPIVVAAVLHKAATGKLDIKGALVDAVRGELAKAGA
ncbi:MAG: hypothetical protein ACOYBT_09865 [Polynucleobacter sp.]